MSKRIHFALDPDLHPPHVDSRVIAANIDATPYRTRYAPASVNRVIGSVPVRTRYHQPRPVTRPDMAEYPRQPHSLDADAASSSGIFTPAASPSPRAASPSQGDATSGAFTNTHSPRSSGVWTASCAAERNSRSN
jgi:hypothetical protein